jgi:ornithine carbamoyltransferase
MPTTLSHRRPGSKVEPSRSDLLALLDAADALKRNKRRDGGWRPLQGRYVALLYADGSAADLLSHAVAELGGTAAVLDAGSWRADGRGAEAAAVLGRLYAAIDCRGLPTTVVETIRRHAGVPVFDGLARVDHPLHLLAELMTMREHSGRPLESLRLRLDGDPRTPQYGAATALSRVAGVTLVTGEALSPVTTASCDSPAVHDEADFVLDLAKADEAARLCAMDRQPPIDTERLLRENRRCLMQAQVLGVLG